MTLLEAGQVLVLISQYSGMKLDKAKIQAWHDLIGDLDYLDAIAGVKYHFRTSTDWLQPGHLFVAVKAARKERAEAERLEMARERRELPDASGDTPPDRKAGYAEYRAAVEALALPRRKSALDNSQTVKYNQPCGGEKAVARRSDPARLGQILPRALRSVKEDRAA